MSKVNERLETMATDILVKCDMLKLPVDLVAIARNNGIEVYHGKLPDGVSGAIKYNEEVKKFQIIIEEREPENRQRFTLAHELAHYFLQKEELLQNGDAHFDTMYRRNINPAEAEVDYLAGALLMNSDVLTRLHDSYDSIKLLAKIFKVSESAMTVRLMVLGLL